MTGQSEFHLRGDFVAHGYKYRSDTEAYEVEAQDQTLGANLPLIGLDLDTSSLGALMAYFRGDYDVRPWSDFDPRKLM